MWLQSGVFRSEKGRCGQKVSRLVDSQLLLFGASHLQSDSTTDRPSIGCKVNWLNRQVLVVRTCFFCISFIGRALAKLGRVSAINQILSYLILIQINNIQCNVGQIKLDFGKLYRLFLLSFSYCSYICLLCLAYSVKCLLGLVCLKINVDEN